MKGCVRRVMALLLAALLLAGACPAMETAALAKSARAGKTVVFPVTLRADRVIKARVGMRLKLQTQGAVKSFRSSAPKVASVNAKTGMVVVKKQGRAVITARLANGRKLRLGLRCIDTNLPSAIAIRQGTGGRLRAGRSRKLTVVARYRYPQYVTRKPKLTWQSSDTDVATVEDGRVTAKQAGKAVITAVSANGKKAKYTLVVEGRLTGVKIGIDPGHQTHADTSLEAVAPGSSQQKYKVTEGTQGYASGVYEYALVLKVGLQLRDALKAQGATVYMTRTKNNVNLSNQQRARMMNKKKVSLVLRLHCDGEDTHTRQGIGLYVRKTGTKAAECYRAAEALMARMLEATGASRYGIFKSDTYTGLNWSTVPSILVEMGFMSNAREDLLLNEADYQQKLVQGMVEGICDYLGR